MLMDSSVHQSHFSIWNVRLGIKIVRANEICPLLNPSSHGWIRRSEAPVVTGQFQVNSQRSNTQILSL